MIEITVYGKQFCVKCDRTKAHLEKVKLDYTYVDVEQDPTGRSVVEFLGYKSLPVVTVGDMHWNDYRYEKIKRLAELMGSQEYESLEVQAIEYLRREL